MNKTQKSRQHLCNIYISLFSNASLSFQVANKKTATKIEPAKNPRKTCWYLDTQDWKITVNKKLRNNVIKMLDPIRSTIDFSILSIIKPQYFFFKLMNYFAIEFFQFSQSSSFTTYDQCNKDCCILLLIFQLKSTLHPALKIFL